MIDPEALIAALGLVPHPEGGWYRETWRASAGEDGRGLATAIHFLLEERQRSHWHTVDADELWFWHAGSPLTLGLAADDVKAPEWTTLGPDVIAGHTPQLRIPAGQWQAAEARSGWALVSCVVAPAFEFSGFTLAPDGWAPGA